MNRRRQQLNIKKTPMQYNHGGKISNIWSSNGGITWNWSNEAGEGRGESTFEDAINAAEQALNLEFQDWVLSNQ